jgi:hypothetical protein
MGTRHMLLQMIKMQNWQIFSGIFLLLMNAMVGYSLYTLWKCCLTDPGFVPLDLVSFLSKKETSRIRAQRSVR